MSSATPSNAGLLAESSAYTIGQLRTCMPARVLAFTPPDTCTVQPAIQLRRLIPGTNDTEPVTVASIAHVRVVWPKNYTAPLEVGDWVTLVVADRSLDEWKATGNPVNLPQDVRRFDFTDAYALPGGVPPADPLPPTAWAPGATVLNASDIRLGSSAAADPVVLLSKLTTQLTALKAWLDAHVHAVDPLSGTAILPPVVPSPGVGDLGATKVRGE